MIFKNNNNENKIKKSLNINNNIQNNISEENEINDSSASRGKLIIQKVNAIYQVKKIIFMTLLEKVIKIIIIIQ